MRHLRPISVPVATLGLIFLFFGLIWQGAAQLGVAIALLAMAAGAWRATTGGWPLSRP